jgi:flagellin
MAIGDSGRINTNIGAINALNSLKTINKGLEISQLKLATGLRINEVADDPAGFVISRTLNARSRGLAAALDNVGTAKNVLAIAEGGLTNISDILLTIKDKVTQAASDTQGTAERLAIKNEIDQLTQEIDNIVEETTFNNINLLNGTYSAYYQTGEDTANTTRFTITSGGNYATSLNVDSSNISNEISTASAATVALGKVDSAISTVSQTLQEIGAVISRLSVKESTLSISITNTKSTQSRIEDADIAASQLESTRLLILQQTATAQLAQANVTPQNVLALFV